MPPCCSCTALRRAERSARAAAHWSEDTDILAKAVYSRADREICKPVLDRLTARQGRVTGDYSPFWHERGWAHDAGRTLRAEQLVADPGTAHPHRLAWTTAPLRSDLRVNGAPETSVRASLDCTSPYTTALLVDYGTATRAIAGTVRDTSRLVCYGEGVPGDTGCAYRTKHRTETTDSRS